MYPKRIVCLAAEIPDLLHRLGALDRVVGISAYTTGPKEALRLPKVSGFQTGNLRRIAELRPDLAILTSDVQKELAAGLADAGIPTLHLQPHRLEDLFQNISLVGGVVGKPVEAEELANWLRAELKQIAEKAEKRLWRPRVYFEEWMDPMICGTGWVSDIIELAGGQDVFRTLSVEGRKAQKRIVTPQDIIEAGPELVLASWCGKPFEREVFIARTGFDAIPAVRRGAVYELDGTILQFGPGLIDSIRQVAELIEKQVMRT